MHTHMYMHTYMYAHQKMRLQGRMGRNKINMFKVLCMPFLSQEEVFSLLLLVTRMGLLSSLDHSLVDVATKFNTILRRFAIVWFIFAAGFLLYHFRHDKGDKERTYFNSGVVLMTIALCFNSVLLYWLSRVRTKQHTARMKLADEVFANTPKTLGGAGYDSFSELDNSVFAYDKISLA